MEQYLIDIIFIVIFLISVLAAARKGFLLSLLEIGASVASVIAAKVLSAPLAQLVYNDYARGPVLDKVQSLLPADITSGDPQVLMDGLLAQLPPGVVSIAQTYGLVPENVEVVDNAAAFFSIDNLEMLYIKPFCLTVFELLAMVIVFYVLFVVLRFAVRLIDVAIHRNKPQKINRIAGGLLGAVKAVIPIAVFAVLLNLAADYKLNDTLTAAVENSRICAVIDEAVVSLSSDKNIVTTE
ncbi:MAG: CvpA family protein [Clostridia bacterium]|nr:CvpA family protein [Clostridia bacterium]